MFGYALTRGGNMRRHQNTPNRTCRAEVLPGLPGGRGLTNATPQKGCKPFVLLAGASALLMGVALPSDAEAQDLGSTVALFGVLGAETVTNTGPTIIQDANLGVSPGTAITGFFGTTTNEGPGQVIGGTVHQGDAVAELAQTEADTLFTSIMNLPHPGGNDLTGDDLGGLTLLGGVYNFDTTAGLTGILTLDGANDPDSIWAFKIGTGLTVASGSSVLLINQADPNNVFWAVGTQATLGSGSTMVGTIVAGTTVAMESTAKIICGRAIALTAEVTMINNTITLCTSPPPPPGPPACHCPPLMLVQLAAMIAPCWLQFPPPPEGWLLPS